MLIKGSECMVLGISNQAICHRGSSLSQRLQQGPAYCTSEEVEAANWFITRVQGPLSKFDRSSYIEWLKHELNFTGTVTINVPVDVSNPRRPLIVKQLFLEHGCVCIEEKPWYARVNFDESILSSVSMTFKAWNSGVPYFGAPY